MTQSQRISSDRNFWQVNPQPSGDESPSTFSKLVIGTLAATTTLLSLTVWGSSRVFGSSAALRLGGPQPLKPHASELALPRYSRAPRIGCFPANSTFCREQPPMPPTQPGYFALCAVFRNEPAADLDEWIDYHRNLGVDQFLLYDHNSSSVPQMKNLGAPDVRLERFDWWTLKAPQTDVYNECIDKFAGHFQWLGFIDMDEFLVPTDVERNLPNILQPFEDKGALVVNWRLLGTSGHQTRPAGGVVQNFDKCVPHDYAKNRAVKVIGNTRYLDTSVSPHLASYVGKKGEVTEHNVPRDPKIFWTKNVSTDVISLYHYVTKSVGEFNGKVKKSSASGVARKPSFLFEMDGNSTEKCFGTQQAAARWSRTQETEETHKVG